MQFEFIPLVKNNIKLCPQQKLYAIHLRSHWYIEESADLYMPWEANNAVKWQLTSNSNNAIIKLLTCRLGPLRITYTIIESSSILGILHNNVQIIEKNDYFNHNHKKQLNCKHLLWEAEHPLVDLFSPHLQSYQKSFFAWFLQVKHLQKLQDVLASAFLTWNIIKNHLAPQNGLTEKSMDSKVIKLKIVHYWIHSKNQQVHLELI